MQPSTIAFSLPPWIQEFTREIDYIKDIEERTKFVIEASRRNVLEKTGGPFAAAIFELESGKLVSLGVNLVTNQGLSILHGEIVAIAVAQAKLSTYDLGNQNLVQHELVTSTEPCAMCLGAIPWSGVTRVITSATDYDARQIGFDEGAKIADWTGALQDRGIEVLTEINRDRAQEVLDLYAQSSGEIYNSRGKSD
ncbi:MAG: nucleoside deaminase [Cyanobacteria bacterium J06638_38]